MPGIATSPQLRKSRGTTKRQDSPDFARRLAREREWEQIPPMPDRRKGSRSSHAAQDSGVPSGSGSREWPTPERLGPSTVEFYGEGSGRCDGDRSTEPGGEENFADSLAGMQQKNAASKQS